MPDTRSLLGVFRRGGGGVRYVQGMVMSRHGMVWVCIETVKHRETVNLGRSRQKINIFVHCMLLNMT